MKKLSLAVIAFVLLLIPVATFAIDLGGDIAAGAARYLGMGAGADEAAPDPGVGPDVPSRTDPKSRLPGIGGR